MFIRAVWRSTRVADRNRRLREMGVPQTHKPDIIGVCPADFPNMTRGLFDRAPH